MNAKIEIKTKKKIETSKMTFYAKLIKIKRKTKKKPTEIFKLYPTTTICSYYSKREIK